MGIKVIAHRQGYYGHFREPGDEFEIENEEAFHDSWMDRADARPTKRQKPAQVQTTGNNPAGALPRNPDLEADLS